MSFGTRRFLQYTDRYDVVQRYEIQEWNYVGSAEEIKTPNGIDFEHEELTVAEDILKLYENPIQKGSLDLKLILETIADEQLVQDIFAADEDQFRLVWKQNGTEYWKGAILNDLLEYTEMPLVAKPQASVFAKDFSYLDGIDYTNTEGGRGTLIEIIAELLNGMGHGLEIHTITSWTSENTSDAVDFLQQHKIDRYALQSYAQTADEENETFTYLEALEHICRSFCLILKQVDGVFLIEQYSAYEDPTQVLLTTYDSAGVELTSGITDVTGNAQTLIKGISQTRQYPGIKSARVKYDHRTSVTGIQFPSSILLDANNLSEVYSQLFVSDGNQSVNFNGQVLAETADTITDFEQWVLYTIQAGSYYWNADTQSWDPSFVSNKLILTDTYLTDGKVGWETFFNVTTTEAPPEADGALSIEVFAARNDTDGVADWTEWVDLQARVINASSEQNSESIDYKLTQTGIYSHRYDHGAILFGDGPVEFARGSITTDADVFTTDDWRRRGSLEAYRNHAANVLKEIVDVQRSGIKRTEADTENGYNPREVKSYRGSYYVYGGGSYNGDVWSPILIQIKIETAADDDVKTLPKFDAVSSSSTTTGGGSSGGSDFDQDDADARYLQKSLNGSDIPDIAQFRANTGLTIGTHVQAWDARLDDLSGLSATQAGYVLAMDQGVASTDSPTFAGGTITGDLSIPNATFATDHALTGAVADLRYDNYTSWFVQANSEASVGIGSSDTLTFQEGTGIGISRTGNTLTIENTSTNTNNFVDGIQFGGTQGDDIILELTRSGGLATLDLPMQDHIKAYFDTVYSPLGHGHNTATQVADGFMSSTDKTKLDGIPVGADNYSSWSLQANSAASTQIGSSETVTFQESTGITISRSGNTITIANTVSNTNYFLSAVDYIGLVGDDLTLDFTISGGTDVTFDLLSGGYLTGYLSTQYSTIGHDHAFTEITGTITNAQHGNRSGGSLHAAATTSAAGFMSSADKTKLNGIASGADNYGSWSLQINSDPSIGVNANETVTFIAGDDISLSRNNRTITISATGNTTNNFVSNMTFGGTLGDDIVLELERSGLVTLDLDLAPQIKAYTDTLYNNFTYSHPSYGSGDQPASALSGASVISQITVNSNGHVTGVSTRNLTAGNVGALASSHPASGVTSTKITNWDNAYGWGDWATGLQSWTLNADTFISLSGATNTYLKGIQFLEGGHSWGQTGTYGMRFYYEPDANVGYLQMGAQTSIRTAMSIIRDTAVVNFEHGLRVTGTTKASGNFYGGTSNPTNTARTNYDGYLYANRFYAQDFILI